MEQGVVSCFYSYSFTYYRYVAKNIYSYQLIASLCHGLFI